ncbi:hypothetical protein HELRODRAFT_162543 [Helobdella robusta]|uniref:Uncharacterized protein n=1 Tax=Helobdella robusta TaxID=6412 RepID=T1EST7_HELRO|nr:hypothetical protein HELRODRAFT_162543 [Helobdella robusta]ESN99062.1 hypothetical protein HELRODRAFT_162543 [Helobdella robusta]
MKKITPNNLMDDKNKLELKKFCGEATVVTSSRWLHPALLILSQHSSVLAIVTNKIDIRLLNQNISPINRAENVIGRKKSVMSRSTYYVGMKLSGKAICSISTTIRQYFLYEVLVTESVDGSCVHLSEILNLRNNEHLTIVGSYNTGVGNIEIIEVITAIQITMVRWNDVMYQASGYDAAVTEVKQKSKLKKRASMKYKANSKMQCTEQAPFW